MRSRRQYPLITHRLRTADSRAPLTHLAMWGGVGHTCRREGIRDALAFAVTVREDEDLPPAGAQEMDEAAGDSLENNGDI